MSTQKLKVWLTGSSGQLGTALLNLFPTNEKFEWLTSTRDEVNLLYDEPIDLFLKRHNPHFIVNAAAYTAVDQAELNQEEAMRLNGLLPEQLGNYGIPLIHISTDHIFGGANASKREAPYTEEDLPDPANFYGKSKAEGEQRLQATTQEHYILRTSWLYGPMDWGKSFYKSIRINALAGKSLRVVEDEVGSPTSTFTLARAIIAILERWNSPNHIPYGTYHVADLGEVSRYHLATTILALDSKTAQTPCQPCLQSDLQSIAQRPHYSALDSGKLMHHLPHLFHPWQEALEEVYQFEEKNNDQ